MHFKGQKARLLVFLVNLHFVKYWHLFKLLVHYVKFNGLEHFLLSFIIILALLSLFGLNGQLQVNLFLPSFTDFTEYSI